MNKILSGNEAIARGVYEAGVTVAAAYPGTPSTEIMDNVGALYKEDIYCEWSVNEKVAFEVAAGASIGGARSFSAFKHVGMNVAADPIFSMSYAGVNGGMVFVTADDPGCWSSQNEQDNRYYAPHSKIPMLEPSDSQECKDYTVAAYRLSEVFDTPVMIRVTTRVCHSKSAVEFGEREMRGTGKYLRDPAKYALLPATAKKRHVAKEQQLKRLEEVAYSSELNRVEESEGSEIGIITSGISYQHAREAFAGKKASFLKLGITYPLSERLIREFASKYKTIYVIEENDPYLETQIRAMGVECTGKERIPVCDELNAGIVRKALFGCEVDALYTVEASAPARPPALCAGCPHRGFFFALSKKLDRVVPAGDIGCYALGSQEPFKGFDYSLCMGAGFSSLLGLSIALKAQGDSRKPIGMVGDSTFFHSGITSLIDLVCAEADVIACVLDNSITAMTGHQDNPGTARNLMGQPTRPIDIEKIVRALGIDDEHIRVVDPLNMSAMDKALNEGIEASGTFVIIAKRPCVLIKEVARANAGRYAVIDPDKCVGCRMCIRTACPALAFIDGKAVVSEGSGCTGCGLCMSQCRLGAITIREGK